MAGPNAPYTNLDSDQVLKQAFDEAEDRLRVDAQVTATISSITIDSHQSDIAIQDRLNDNLLKINADGSIDANVVVSASSGDNIAISDGTDTLAVNPGGSINALVGSASVPLDYDQGLVSYPSATQEVYTYKKLGVNVKVVTINYTDATKSNISGWTIA